ncbi:coagulation factor X-like [Genypterus blacodes]|uniref:coagulation factor X-like n=1 Tax=Genypterus blacodes TaxID=154954 RepID=UPI003F75BF48
MSPGCGAFILSLSLVACFLQALAQGPALRLPPEAQSVFLRSKRANSFLVEEILQGNLERECLEELCSYEEAREYFEDDERTMSFWNVYQDGDQCDPLPCLHGGNCTDKLGGFHCSCSPPYYGPVCELGASGRPPTAELTEADIPVCATKGPTACHQFCTVSLYSITCSCLTGFRLHSDERSCLPEVEFPCGTVPSSSDTDQLNKAVCLHGNCPWEVSLVSSRGMEMCSGVLLGRRTVLTLASCLLLGSGYVFQHPSTVYVVVGDGAKAVPVQALYFHSRFSKDHYDNDLVLLQLVQPLIFGPTLIHLCLPTKDFSENILMNFGRTALIGRRANRQRRNLTYKTLDECRRQLNLSHPLSNKMFCMTSRNGAERSQNGQESLKRERHIQNKPQTGNERQNRIQESPNGATGTQNGTRDQQNRTPRHQNPRIDKQNGTEERANGSLEHPIERHKSPNGTQGRANGSLEHPIERHESQNGTQGRFNGSQEHQIERHKNHNKTQGRANGANNKSGLSNNSSTDSKIQQRPQKPDGTSRSEVGSRRCNGLLPGSPVATEKEGTVFLTGLLISAPANCDGSGGLVFSKLSRYLSWIRQRLELAEGHLTPQVLSYPEDW